MLSAFSRRLAYSNRVALSNLSYQSTHGESSTAALSMCLSFSPTSRRHITSNSRRHYAAPTDPIAWLKSRQLKSNEPAFESHAQGHNRRRNHKPKKTYNDQPRKCQDPTLWAVEEGERGMHLDVYTIRLTHPEMDGVVVLDRHWLRDSCNCHVCVDKDSGQKNYGTCDVPLDLAIESCRKTEDGNLEVVWRNDFMCPEEQSHVSSYSANMIGSIFSGNTAKKPKFPQPVLWDKETFEKGRLTLDYNNWIANEHDFARGLGQLHTHGLLFLENVPQSETSVVDIVNKIGCLQETFYGRIWDVRSKPQAENVAYTSSFLGLHQDLLYTNSPPRIQVLHCLENTCEGGESIFSDALRAAHLMRLGPPQLFIPLVYRPVRYAYKKHGQHYEMSRRVLTNDLNQIFWSPPFQSSDQNILKSHTGSKNYRQWVKAATKFRELLEQEHWVYQYKMKPGECVLFDNLRVLHGRNKFDTSTGSRWLKGAYLANDVFYSKLATMSPALLALGLSGPTQAPEQAADLMKKYNVWSGEHELEEQNEKMNKTKTGAFL